MFGELSFWQMLMKGGITVVILIGISVLSWWIIIDKAIRFVRIRVKPREFMDKVVGLIEKKDFDSVITLCESTPGPVAAVVLEGIRNRKKDEAKLEAAMQRAMNIESERMQSGLGILGTIGNITPFIGLFGTVLGIIKAFHDLSLSSGGGPAVVASGIAEALVATATGIFVAIPAVIFYNLYVRTVDSIENEAVNAASELSDMLKD
ncbi:MAG: MotA/TolQ/ExbB proton channel family protein [Spirochaetia bacterium]|nr:MotA/TolQ/ExbB proton channel family protein [Spirochaetia bacterium]